MPAVGSEQAGSRRSSSNDRRTPGVDSQAPGSPNATSAANCPPATERRKNVPTLGSNAESVASATSKLKSQLLGQQSALNRMLEMATALKATSAKSKSPQVQAAIGDILGTVDASYRDADGCAAPFHLEPDTGRYARRRVAGAAGADSAGTAKTEKAVTAAEAAAEAAATAAEAAAEAATAAEATTAAEAATAAAEAATAATAAAEAATAATAAAAAAAAEAATATGKLERGGEEEEEAAHAAITLSSTRPPTAANGKLAMLRQRAPKTAAVTIDRPAEGASLAAVMKKVAGTINLGALGVRVLTSRRTRAGGILLEVEGEEKAALLEGKIREVAGDTARVRRPQRKTPVLLLNIPEWAEAEDVVSGLAGAGIVVEAKSVSIRSNGGKRGDLDRVARVDLPFRDAIALAVAKAVEVGWTRCRVKLLEKRQSTCFRCQQKGHHAAECRSEAKPRSCFGCGSSDHLARECTRKGKQRSSGGAAGAAGAAAAGEGAKERSQAEGPSRSAGRPASPPSG
ncbi:hypothetical protein QTP88_029409 [Uroleucon formosanum]